MMHLLVTLLLAVAVGATPAVPVRPLKDMAGSDMTTPELITTNGYPAEVHFVTTEDGYILELHRIPHGRGGVRQEGRPVVYLQHCLLCSSADFVMNTPDKGLAYHLADTGYDVWMGNFRGNTYAKKHTSLNPKKGPFWEFTWGEMGYYDIPASIDYVLNLTKQESIPYVGFSMGATAFFAMLSDRPEYEAKIKVAALMAPAIHMEDMQGPISQMTKYAHTFDSILSILGVHEMFPSSNWMHHFVNKFCNDHIITDRLCYEVIYLLAGPSDGEINKHYLPVILSHTPAGTSAHTLNHYAQLHQSKIYQKYDWGKKGNMARYGQPKPPAYNIEGINVPIGLFWSDSDWLATPQNIARLEKELPNIVVSHKVQKEKFNHLDFAWGLHADELAYNYVYELLAKYE